MGLINGTTPESLVNDEKESVSNIIKAIHKLKCHEVISDTLTEEELVNIIKKTKERKASSPSVRHHAHYKVWATNRILCDILFKMITIPMKYEIIPQRWNNIQDCMLEKIAGNPRIDKLRIIQLFEANLNYVLKIVYEKKLARMATKHKIILEIQYGNKEQINANMGAL